MKKVLWMIMLIYNNFDVGHDIFVHIHIMVTGGEFVDFKLNVTLAIEDSLFFRILIIFGMAAIKLL